ncbi:MAG: DUF4349 domain-containing protein [Chitinophagaceae bacterium]|nr:DUF4349 domain-containing protein [Chitinophagaceae bacterium]
MKALYCLYILSCSLFIFSCNNSTIKQQEDVAALSDTTSVNGFSGDEVKLVKTAGLHCKVHEVEKSARVVSALAQQFGGMVFNLSTEYEETGRNELQLSDDSLMIVTVATPQANMTLRIPSQNLEAFMYGVADIGYFTRSSTLNIDDRSLQYMENILKQKNRTAVIAGSSIRSDKSFTHTRSIEVKDDVIDKQLANKNIDAQVNYSTVSLTLYQNQVIRKEVVANYAVNDYQLPFSQRLGNAIANGWQLFQSFLLVLAHLWMFVFIAAGAYCYYRFLQHKRKMGSLALKHSS